MDFDELLKRSQKNETSRNTGSFNLDDKDAIPSNSKTFDDYLHKLNQGKFQRSLDADTIDISHGKIRTPTRLAGIDAPESAQELGPYAHAYLDQLIGSNQDITTGSVSKDRHGRDVATVYSNGKHVSPLLVRMGLAKVYDQYLDNVSPKERKELLEAQDIAKSRGYGVWDAKYGDGDAEAYRRTQGAGKSYLGHDMRAPIDSDTVTVQDIYRKMVSDGKITDTLKLGSGNRKSTPYFDVLKESHDGDSESKVYGKDKYVEEEGWLDHVFGALDYAGNISRSAIKGAIDENGSVWDYAKQAALKERRTSAESLKDTITGKMGLGKLRMGKDDGNFQFGDVGDFVLDLGVDIATDPLTWVTAGFSSVAKGGKLAKIVPNIHKGAVDAKLGIMSESALKYAKYKVASNAAIGAVYGAGVTDQDDDIGTRLLAISAGAALGKYSGKGLDKAGKFFKTGFNEASDWYAKTTRAGLMDETKLANFSASKEIAIKSYDKVRNIAEWIRQGRYEALKNLEDPIDKIRAAELMENLKTEFIRRRKVYEKRLKVKPTHPAYNGIITNFNRRVQKGMMKDYLPSLLEKEKDDIAQAVLAWGEHNDDVIRKLNGVLTEGGGKPMVGIRWHIDDIMKKVDVKESEEMFGRFQIYKANNLTRSEAPIEIAAQHYAKETGKQLSPQQFMEVAKTDKGAQELLAKARDASYGTYAEDFAKKFLDEKERDAVNFMQEFSETAAKQKGVQRLETALGFYDKATNWAKANMLYFSMSWIKNNYFDNMAKSYVENGWHGLMDSATMGKFQKGVFSDVKDLYANKLNRVYKADDMKDALHRGVLDNPMFKSLDDRELRDYMFRPKQIAEAEEKSTLKLLGKAGKLWFNNPYVGFVRNTGSLMEGTARMMTYTRAKDAILSTPAFKNASKEQIAKAKDMAADLVKKTFFDYGDVTHFENAVFKRLIPFYSFYSKNLPYWVKSSVDPEKVGRMLALEKARRNVGSDPDSSDKQGMSPYLIDAGARKFGRTAKGETEYGIFPSGSMYDAFNMINPLNAPSQVIDKGHAGLKTAYEVISKHDLFDDTDLRPSKSKDGKKFLFSRGHKYRALGVPGVKLDEKGNPYADKDYIVYVDKVMSTVWPHGLVDQVAGSVGKVRTGKETFVESLMNLSSPMKTVKVSDAYARQIRQRKHKED